MATKQPTRPKADAVEIPEAVLNSLRERQLQLRGANQELMERIALVAGSLRPGREVRGANLDEGVIYYEALEPVGQ